MTRHALSLSLLPALLCCSLAALADDSFVYGKLGTGSTTATLGYGHLFSDSLAGRIGLGRSSGSDYDENFGANRYRLAPKSTTSLEALLDWYPLSGSGLRLSGGLSYANQATQTATSTASYTLNGHRYSAAEAGQLQLQSRDYKLAPQFELGWESAPASKPGWRLVSDLNLRLPKRRDTTLSTTGGSGNTTLADDLATERRRVAADANGTRFKLGVSVGAAYTF